MHIQGCVPAGLQCDSHEEKGKQTHLRGHEAMEGCETVEISGVGGHCATRQDALPLIP